MTKAQIDQKPKEKASKNRGPRTTVSLDPLIFEWAKQAVKELGFNNNFSAYISYLVRKDRDMRNLSSPPSSPSAALSPKAAELLEEAARRARSPHGR